MNRRDLIRGIGRAICAGYTAPFLPSLLVAGAVPASPGFAFGRNGDSELFVTNFDVLRNGIDLKQGKDYIQVSSTQIEMLIESRMDDVFSVRVRKKMVNPSVELTFEVD